MTDKKVTVKPLNIQECSFNIKGTVPLIVHRFSQKTITQIEEKQQKKSKERPERNPEQEMKDAMYLFADGKRSGFPAVGFKASMIRAGKDLNYVMKDLQGQFFVQSDESEFVEIDGDAELRTDMVRVGMGSPDIRYRPMYKDWGAKIRIQYDANAISVEQLAQLLTKAGFGVGVGEWRPEKSKTGSYGLFKIVNY